MRIREFAFHYVSVHSPASTFSASERVNPGVAVTSYTPASRTAVITLVILSGKAAGGRTRAKNLGEPPCDGIRRDPSLRSG